MADTLRLQLITPERPVLDVQCDEVRAPGATGSFGIRPGHTAFVSTLGAGALVYIQNGVTHRYAVIDGFVEVDEDRVVVLAEEAVHADEIDPAEEARVIEEARARMAGESPESHVYRREAALVRRATARSLAVRD